VPADCIIQVASAGIGLGHRLLMLNLLVEHMKERAGVSFRTMAEVAGEWKGRHPLERIPMNAHGRHNDGLGNATVCRLRSRCW
jgi:hypothetical protein